MNDQRSKEAFLPQAGEIEELIPRPMLFPDEDPATYQGLRQALLGDLAPGTPYGRVLAENIVTLEWEIIRHRRMRDTLIEGKARDLAIGAIDSGKIQEPLSPGEAPKRLGFALVGGDRAGGAAEMAVAALDERGFSLEEIFAKAYSAVAGQVEVHEKKLAELEKRRRHLREDYDRLKASRARLADDAEVIE